MGLPVTPLTWFAALLPIVVLLVLLLRLRWSAVEASVVSLAVAAVTALTVFDAPFALVGGEVGKGIWNSLAIIGITFPAVLMYEVSRQANGFAVIQREMTRLVPDRLLQVLALGWCFTGFLQGPSGFGVPIAVAAPLLIGIGVKPLWAVVIPLMSQTWGTTFGTLALGWESLVLQTDLAQQVGSARYWSTAFWSAVMTGTLCPVAGMLTCWFYGRWRGIWHGLPAVALLGGIQVLGLVALSQVTPVLSAVIPSTLALGAAFLVARLPVYARPDTTPSALLNPSDNAVQADSPLGLHQALLPYYLLSIISVVVLLTPPLHDWLASWKTGFAFPQTQTGYGVVNPATGLYAPIAWLVHSGSFLLLTSALSAAYYARLGLIRRADLRVIGRNTMQKAVPASLSVVFLIAMSKVMSGSGQVEVLALGTASVTGPYFALLSPFIGVLGSFMSASNVSSNILFGQFQQSMARLIGVNDLALLAAQTTGGAIGTMCSPSTVMLGTTTAGIPGREGQVISRLLVVVLALALCAGAAACLLG
ncbi:MAG TPA: L-lactate permease [Candidatus Avidesulfovibrio excrementigallinarum]|nr:L-lactate permease [Candidatus Avidesulfovibrio excrementigallinarum]